MSAPKAKLEFASISLDKAKNNITNELKPISKNLIKCFLFLIKFLLRIITLNYKVICLFPIYKNSPKLYNILKLFRFILFKLYIYIKKRIVFLLLTTFSVRLTLILSFILLYLFIKMLYSTLL